MIPVALTIAGSDPSGGAGLQADLKTFHQFGVYGMSVVTLLTAQNTQTVKQIKPIEPSFILDQLDVVLEDIQPQAAKTGALGRSDIIQAIANRAPFFNFPLILDPVMVSKHGSPLMDDDAVETLKEALIPHAYLITPNIHEASALAEIDISSIDTMKQAAEAISHLGVKHVLIKGGKHFENALDLLYSDEATYEFPSKRIETNHTHGTGCAYSAAIAALLASGHNLLTAVKKAKAFITAAIEQHPNVGHGCGPIGFHAPFTE